MIREVGINNRIYDYDESRMPANVCRLRRYHYF